MAIQFNPDRWAQVRETYTKWWDGSLKRPIFQVTQRIGTGPDPHPHVPVLSQATCADFSWTPEEVIDKDVYKRQSIESEDARNGLRAIIGLQLGIIPQ